MSMAWTCLRLLYKATHHARWGALRLQPAPQPWPSTASEGCWGTSMAHPRASQELRFVLMPIKAYLPILCASTWDDEWRREETIDRGIGNKQEDNGGGGGGGVATGCWQERLDSLPAQEKITFAPDNSHTFLELWSLGSKTCHSAIGMQWNDQEGSGFLPCSQQVTYILSINVPFVQLWPGPRACHGHGFVYLSSSRFYPCENSRPKKEERSIN